MSIKPHPPMLRECIVNRLRDEGIFRQDGWENRISYGCGPTYGYSSLNSRQVNKASLKMRFSKLSDERTRSVLRSLQTLIANSNDRYISGFQIAPLELPLQSLRFVVPTFIPDRLMQANRQLMKYIEHDLRPYSAAIDENILYTPPIVEWIGANYLVLDGTHRLLAAHRRDLTSVITLVVSHPSPLPSPGHQFGVSSLRRREEGELWEAAIENYRPSYFREIGPTVEEIHKHLGHRFGSRLPASIVSS